MTADIDQWTHGIHQGDAVEVLEEMPSDSVHFCMTSPPYYGQRDYDVDGQIGVEDRLQAYIDRLAEVTSELQRVLRDDGSFWLNLGDCYSGSGRGAWDHPEAEEKKESWTWSDGDAPDCDSDLPQKSLMMAPARVALRLQEQGWILRNKVTWEKPNAMPESVKDRLTTTTEEVYHFVQQPRYYYNLDAIREDYADGTLERVKYGDYTERDYPGQPGSQMRDIADYTHHGGKNPGDVFKVNTASYPDAHFATYPRELCRTPIEASAPRYVCSECGSPYGWRREITTTEGDEKTEETIVAGQWPTLRRDVDGVHEERRIALCGCGDVEPEGGVVLDPFAGAGTTLMVAEDLDRQGVGIELNAEYVALAEKRVGYPVSNPELLTEDGQTLLSEAADAAGGGG